MRKFLAPLIVGSLLVIGVVVLNAHVPSGPPLVYQDPLVEATNACYHKHERFVQPITETDKGNLLWWCARHSLNR